ncbi:MAG: pectinesterase family protein [Clostridiales bacterium]|nr:pectinesterase family protein [Clostridiales bacterium]
MNKLTKLLSVFVIAGAIGAGVVGGVGCTKKGGSGSSGDGDVHHTDSHQLDYEDNHDDATHKVTCSVAGCDYVGDDEQPHDYDGGDECIHCHAEKPSDGGGEQTQYEVADYTCDFTNSSVAAYNSSKAKTPNDISIGKFTIGTGVYVEGSGAGLKLAKGNVNTQQKAAAVKFEFTGIEGKNFISFRAKGANESGDIIKLCKANGTVVKEFALTKTETDYSFGYDFTNNTGDTIEAGDYYIGCTASVRIGNLVVKEYVEISPIVEIKCSGAQAQFVQGATFTTKGLVVTAVKQNGVEVPLGATDYTTNASEISTATAGQKTVNISYTPAGSSTPLTTSYNVNVVEVTGVKTNAEFMTKVYIKGATALDTANLCVYAVLDGDETNTEKVTNFTVDADSYDLSTAGEYTLKVKYGDFNEEKVKITVLDSAIQAVNGTVNIGVDCTATTDGAEVGGVVTFKSLGAAIDYLEASKLDASVKKVVNIKPGTYTEKITTDLANLTLIGAGTTCDDVKIEYNVVEAMVNPVTGGFWSLEAAVLTVTGTGFKAYNLSINNTFDYVNHSKDPELQQGNQSVQGLALRLESDKAVLYNCHLFGNQDTLYMRSGRSYFYKTQIDGNIDFIFGENTGIAYFEECEIKAINVKGHVTAAKHGDKDIKPDYGYIFDNCAFTDDGNLAENDFDLGRTWGTKATVAYLNCSFTNVYAMKFANMNGDPSQADFKLYNCTRDGVAVTAVAGGSILDSAAAANYTKANIFGASNGNVGYTAAWNCDTELDNLKTIIEGGELPEDPTKEINLKDVDLAGNCADLISEKYSDLLTWTGTANLEAGKPENGVKVGLDTVITFNVVGEVSLGVGYQGMVPSDYLIKYTDGKATIKFNKISGQYGDYIGEIIIDTSKTPADTQTVNVTFDYNDEDATANSVWEVAVGVPLGKPQDPTRAGYTFTGWQFNGTDYAFTENVTEEFTLIAQWEIKSALPDYSFSSGETTVNLYEFETCDNLQGANGSYRGVIVEVPSGCKFDPRTPGNNDVQINVNAATEAYVKIKFKVAAGTTKEQVDISFTAQAGNSYVPTFTHDIETSDTDTYVVVTITNNSYPTTMTVTID